MTSATHVAHPSPGSVPTAAQQARTQARHSTAVPSLASLTGFMSSTKANGTRLNYSSGGVESVASEELFTTRANTLYQQPSPPLSTTSSAEPMDLLPSHRHPSSSQHQQLIPRPPSPSEDRSRKPRDSITAGMRREWDFTLQFVHAAAQVLVPCSPLWTYGFIELEQTGIGVARNGQPDTVAAELPLLRALTYTDRTAVVVRQDVTKRARAGSEAMAGPAMTIISGDDHHQKHRGSASGNTVHDRQHSSHEAAALLRDYTPKTRMSVSLPQQPDRTVADSTGEEGEEEGWLEKAKTVDLYYCRPRPDMTIEAFCKHCLCFILRDPHVVSVDGDTHLSGLRIDDKLRCPYQLGGTGHGTYAAFHFRYTVRDQMELQERHVYAIGIMMEQRGYFLQAACTDAVELEGYVRSVLLPTYAARGMARFGAGVSYHNVAPTTLLTEQQEAYGELQYVDQEAAIIFATPVYPMRLRPDYAPAKTVGVGSIACMTMELGIWEQLLDDAVAAELLGVAKYRITNVVLSVEVEEVARMGYPTVMSAEQYSELKTRRVAEVFPDAKMVGQGINVRLGCRIGRGRTLTFTYEPLGCVVKALVASTLVGNLGITVLYFTRLTGGLFEAHLYVVQQLLAGLEYLPQNSSVRQARVSRRHVMNVHLGEEDLPMAYRCAATDTTHHTACVSPSSLSMKGDAATAAPPHPASFDTSSAADVAAAQQRHVRLLALGNDGRAEDGVEVAVPVEEGGLPHGTARPAKPYTDSTTMRIAYGPGVTATPNGNDNLNNNGRPSSASTLSVTPVPMAGGVMTNGEEGDCEAWCSRRVSAEGDGVLPGIRNGAAHNTGDAAHNSLVIGGDDLPHLLEASSDVLGHKEEDEVPAAEEEEEASTNAVVRVSPGAALSLLDGATVAAVHPVPVSEESTTELDTAAESPSAGSDRAKAATPTPPPPQLFFSHANILPDGGLAGEKVQTSVDGTRDTRAQSTIAESAKSAVQHRQEQEQQRLYEELVGKPNAAVLQALKDTNGDALYGPSLRDLYARCCAAQHCRSNSYLAQKLPSDPALTYAVEELDMSSNYVGHNGFVAVLHLLEHLPKLRVVLFNNMALDNVDVENACYVLASHPTVRAVHMEGNSGISLPAMRHLSALLRANPSIEVLSLSGTRLSPTLIAKLQEDAQQRR